MMQAAQYRDTLVAGLRQDVALAPLTWLRVGGRAEWFFEPASLTALQAFLQHNEKTITLLGGGSNVLVRDGGIRGVVIRLGRGFTSVAWQDGTVRVGAGVPLVSLARQAQQKSRGGLEFLSGIPGRIGGAVAMNAGAFDNDMSHILQEVTIVDKTGTVRVVKKDGLQFHYRGNKFVGDGVVVEAVLACPHRNRTSIAKTMMEMRTQRQGNQPIAVRTGGSTFKNPQGYQAWQLIDAAGCRGLRIGQACVSQKHCNFLVNEGKATGEELERLGETIRQKVKAHSGIALAWEIQRLGEACYDENA
ncbi:MAG: UDP-N-acetylmuramate dehydrogenase [Alphaproteobacteria bacterium GM202ARS2]|nr:UDP-N-acetylmuramate dehydrogenase [Alphaproteobacteria bacterium GM202ARS2]